MATSCLKNDINFLLGILNFFRELLRFSNQKDFDYYKIVNIFFKISKIEYP